MTTPLQDVRSPDWTPHAPVVALFLHGYGSNEHDLTGLVAPLGLSLPWASLRAPVELGHGAAWLPVTTPGNPDPQIVAGATDTIWAWVDAHLSPDTRVVPIGFSQGGLMASQLLRTRPERVVAPVILSGFVLGAHHNPATTCSPSTVRPCSVAVAPKTGSSLRRRSPAPNRGCQRTHASTATCTPGWRTGSTPPRSPKCATSSMRSSAAAPGKSRHSV